MIHNLTLKNFKQHTNLVVGFTTGLNVITGENGAGKSTILKGILYALFGAAAAGKKEHLSTWGTEDKMEVSLTVDVNGKKLEILRSFDKSVIYSGDDLLASGHTPCTKFIEQELGLDYKQFKHLLYAGQGETQSLLRMGAADLQRKIEVITKMDGLDTIITLISADLSELTGKLSGMESSPDIPAYELQLAKLTELAESQQINVMETEKMATQTELMLKKEQEKLDIVSKKLSKAKASKVAEQTITTSIDNTLDELEEHAETEPKESAKLLALKITAVQDDTDSKLKKLKQFKLQDNAVAQAQENVDHAESQLSKLMQSEGEFKKYAELLENYKFSQYALDTAQTKLRQAERLEVNCPTCERPFENSTAHLEAQDRAAIVVKEARLKFGLNKRAFDDFKASVPATFAESFDGIKKRCELHVLSCDAALHAAVAAIRTRDTNIDADSLGFMISTQKDALADFERSHGIAVLWEKKQDQLISMLARLTDDLGDLDPSDCEWDDDDLEDAMQSVKELQEEYRVKSMEMVQAKSNFRETTAARNSCCADLKRGEEIVERREALEKDAALRKDLQSYLRTNRARMLDNTWKGITSLTSSYVSEITEGLIRELERDLSGEFTVREGEHVVPVSELSGAREAIVGLGLRIALGKAFFGGSSFLMLDEVTAACSETNAANVAGTLQGLGTQIIMVSHRQGDALNAANIIIL